MSNLTQPTKVAILGGGITGLTTAYYLSNKGFKVSLFEKNNYFGGLAAGFKKNQWSWFLDKSYHHLFDNDHEIINFASRIGFKKIFFKKPITASLYEVKKKSYSRFEIYPLDTAFNLLTFPLLSFSQKITTGLGLFFLKISPFLSLYEKQTAISFLSKTMGKKATEVLFVDLFQKKFGKYAENILASFIWARIKKRSKKLGYVEGGFQSLIDYLVNQLKEKQVQLYLNQPVFEIKKNNTGYLINNQSFDRVISTLPTPVLTKITNQIFPAQFLNNLRKIKYLSSLTLIIESKQPLLDKVYWLNISTKKIPIMGIIQHTNFINNKYYGGKEIVYLGWYLEDNDPILKMTKKELINNIIPYLKHINPNYCSSITDYFLFKTPFAQPIFDQEFRKNKPDFTTPAKNFYLANLDMTYPYDRGTNYAVKLGKEVAKIAFAENLR